MNLSIEKKTVGWVGLAIILLVIMAASSYRAIQQFIETSRWVEHTHEVLTRIENVLSTLKDAETGQRGYLLTGIEEYLEPYHGAVARIEEQIKQLRDLTSDNPRQQRRILLLAQKVTAKQDELQKTIEARRGKSFETALAIVKANHGKKVMDEIRQIVAEMEREEYTLLERRTAESRTNGQHLMWFIIGGGLLSLVILALGSLRLIRELIARQLAEKELHHAHGELEQRARDRNFKGPF